MPLMAPEPKRRRSSRQTQFPDSWNVLRALECDKGSCACHTSARRGRGPTHCPAHHDDKVSCSISQDGDRVLWSCHAGCSQNDVRDALIAKRIWPDLKG